MPRYIDADALRKEFSERPPDYYSTGYILDTIDEQPALSPDEVLGVGKWISVEERLPEPGERVLVTNGGFVCESYLSQSGKWQRGGVDMFFMTPSHWMPLPAPPPKGVE